ncbi:unnamed protein product [Moneuplotes crassus]|uniref:Protein kinase domain-containing protein n=1 Tax=Euplotes crassus TaxID=5936 RepID=A0AAD1XGC9_EUPCR|nr:unnamed protein product [Moneuplotes crassus]
MMDCFPFPVIDGKILLTSFIGKGGFSKVFKAETCDSEFAVKIIRKDKKFERKKEMNLMFHEASILNHIPKHPNVVDFIGANIEGIQDYQGAENEISYIALEFCSNGPLTSFLKKQLGKLSLEACRFYFTQIVSVIHHLHSRNIVHLDIKPDNILLDSNYNAKLTDFGIAQLMTTSDGRLKASLGTKNYMAPEVLSRESDTPYCPFKADVYSLGVLLHILLTGERPSKEASLFSEPSTISEVATGGSPSWMQYQKFESSQESLDMDDTYGPFNLLVSLLSEDPDKRPTINEVMEHPWLTMEMDEDDTTGVYQEMDFRSSLLKSSEHFLN